jgi:hypothetical protein
MPPAPRPIAQTPKRARTKATIEFRLLAAPWPRTASIAAHGHGLLAAFDQAALPAVLLVDAFFGLAAHLATQPPERHCMRILVFWLFLHDPTPSRHLNCLRRLEESGTIGSVLKRGSFRLTVCAEPQMLAKTRDAWPFTATRPEYLLHPIR